MKAAVLGAGEPHFDAHIATLQQLPEVESIILWGENENVLEAFEGKAKISAVFTDLDELLKQDDIFFAIATTRNDLKSEIFNQMLDLGIHIMGEKPIAPTAKEVAQLVKKAEQKGLALGTCYQNRYNPLVLKVRRLIKDGIIGPLMSIEMRMLTTQPKFRNPGSWLFNKQSAGGGMLAWLGCHYIDMIRFISKDEIVSVAAEVATRSGEEIDVEDIASLSMRLGTGTIASLHTGYTLALKGPQYGDMPSYDSHIGVNGKDGRLYWNGSNEPHRLTVESTHPSWADAPVRVTDYSIAKSPAYGGIYGEAFIRDFILAAKGKRDVPASGRDALQVARVIEAAYESSETGQRIGINV